MADSGRPVSTGTGAGRRSRCDLDATPARLLLAVSDQSALIVMRGRDGALR